LNLVLRVSKKMNWNSLAKLLNDHDIEIEQPPIFDSISKNTYFYVTGNTSKIFQLSEETDGIYVEGVDTGG